MPRKSLPISIPQVSGAATTTWQGPLSGCVGHALHLRVWPRAASEGQSGLWSGYQAVSPTEGLCWLRGVPFLQLIHSDGGIFTRVTQGYLVWSFYSLLSPSFPRWFLYLRSNKTNSFYTSTFPYCTAVGSHNCFLDSEILRVWEGTRIGYYVTTSAGSEKALCNYTH